MGILSWIVLGLIAGVLAKWIVPGGKGLGIIMTILLGIVGSFVGGFVGSLVGIGSTGRLDLASIGIAVLGAVILLFVVGKLKG